MLSLARRFSKQLRLMSFAPTSCISRQLIPIRAVVGEFSPHRSFFKNCVADIYMSSVGNGVRATIRMHGVNGSNPSDHYV